MRGLNFYQTMYPRDRQADHVGWHNLIGAKKDLDWARSLACQLNYWRKSRETLTVIFIKISAVLGIQFWRLLLLSLTHGRVSYFKLWQFGVFCPPSVGDGEGRDCAERKMTLVGTFFRISDGFSFRNLDLSHTLFLYSRHSQLKVGKTDIKWGRVFEWLLLQRVLSLLLPWILDRVMVSILIISEGLVNPSRLKFTCG